MTLKINNKPAYRLTAYYIARDHFSTFRAWVDYQFTKPL